MGALKLITGYTCNNSCAFCWDRPLRGKVPDKSYAEILAELADARRKGADAADILGGEATLRPDIFRVLSAARRLGYRRLMITTNGAMLADPGFARALLAAGVTEVRFSLHGDSAGLHDRLAGSPGAFARLIRAMANLRAEGFDNISVNTTLVRANAARLLRIRDLLARLRVRKWNIIYVGEPPGSSGQTPRVSEVAGDIMKCLRSPDFDATLINAPVPCSFLEVSGRVEMFERRARQYVRGRRATEFRSADLKKLPERKRIPACRGCAMRGRCDGVYAAYLKAFGAGELPAPRKAAARGRGKRT